MKSTLQTLLATIFGGIAFGLIMCLLIIEIPRCNSPVKPMTTLRTSPMKHESENQQSTQKKVQVEIPKVHDKDFSAEISDETPKSLDNQLHNIVEITKTLNDENFNSILNLTISNPYSKAISNVQIFISQDGNSFIPDNISEDSWRLVNIDLEGLASGKDKQINIVTKDKGNSNIKYAISTRKIRFIDGSVIGN